ncbi:ATPase [Kocuria sp. p3-SID1433]|uniref:N-acetylglucosamine kinase n=1 Tax=unclassified Kocuria TaxID=2649579 RepID=UPI0021A5129B|nr:MULTISPECIES: BadF/BadG/BcrA/BcrD ATPase family protein [unclassified Kocuria]MCT1602799.1 ATPase [Kocuria sp. p3-SID1428]MCT2180749.1 ATPase [Kocuria sp. p3-SID1433]
MQQRTVIGLDIGGTSTRGLRADGPATAPGAELVVGAEASAGSSNVQNVPRDQARRRLAAVLGELGAAKLDPTARRVDVVIGAGGVDTDDDARRLEQLVREAAGALSGARFRIVHDTRLLLAAAGADEGIALIAGTGSVAWGRTADGSEARRGGWGYLLGDEGSSFWVGREAVRRALRRADAGEPADELDRAVLEARGLSDRTQLIADFHDRFERTAWAGLAAQVDRCASTGHLGARELLGAAAGHLLEMAAGVGEQLGLTGPVVLGGGLGSSSTLVGALSEQAADAGLSAPEPLQVPPVRGTLRLART